jgi:hypothetical protein
MSTLSAGVGPAPGGGAVTFGDLGSAIINKGDDAIVARIISVSIGGAVTGAANVNFETGFVAQQVGSFRAAGFVAPLTTITDGPFQLALPTGNVFLIEM